MGFPEDIALDEVRVSVPDAAAASGGDPMKNPWETGEVWHFNSLLKLTAILGSDLRYSSLVSSGKT